MDFETYKSESKRLNDLTHMLSKDLNTMDWKNESIRSSEVFKEIKQKFDKAFKELQDLNKVINAKEYQKKIKEERRSSWKM